MKATRLAVLALALPTIAAAQTVLPPDIADDGSVTLEEVRANSALLFDRLAGPDGSPIPRERFVDIALPPDLLPEGSDRALLASVFDLLDGDGNGRLTRGEWVAGIERELGFADADGDGRITLEELATARENLDLGDALGIVF